MKQTRQQKLIQTLAQKKFPKIVMLIDAVMLNISVTIMNEHFSRMIKRKCPEIQLAQIFSNMGRDANIKGGGHEIQVILLYDSNARNINYCLPSNLKEELKKVTLQGELGKFNVSSVWCGGIFQKDEMLLELTSFVGNSYEVEKLIIYPFEGDEMIRLTTLLPGITETDLTFFSVVKPKNVRGYTWKVASTPVMQALGISFEKP